MKWNEIVGKTISDVKKYSIKGYDDEPYMELLFTDGTSAMIVAYYGGYTGRSEDEYPSFIDFSDVDKSHLVELNNEN